MTALTTDTGISLDLPNSAITYRFRVTAIDNADNPGAPRLSSSFKTVSVSESSAAMHYTGTWSLSNSAVYVGGKARISSTKNSTASVSFRGNRVGWYSRLGPAYGQAKVYIDGAFVKTVNLNAAAVFDRKLVFTKNWTAVGNHSIRIVVVGTRSSEDRGRPDLLPVAATGSDALLGVVAAQRLPSGLPVQGARVTVAELAAEAGREIPLAAADVRTAIHDLADTMRPLAGF